MDQVKGHLLDLLVESIREINPHVRVYPTSFTRLDPSVLNEILHSSELGHGGSEEDHEEDTWHEHGHGHGHEHAHDHGLADHYQSFSKVYGGIFNRKRLESFFDDLNSSRYGEVVRAKGIFKTSGNWVKLELASGRVHIGPGPEGSDSAVSIIGSDMKVAEMETKLSNCRTD
jgi:G3E family GTPase